MQIKGMDCEAYVFDGGLILRKDLHHYVPVYFFPYDAE